MDRDQALPIEASPRSRVRSYVWFLVSMGAAAWIVWSSRSEIEVLAGASLGLVVVMVGLHLIGLVTQFERFRLVLRHHSEKPVEPALWMQVSARGRLFSFLVPQSGNVYRGLALRDTYQMPLSRYVSSLATQTWLSVVFSLLVATSLAWIATLTGTNGAGLPEAAAVSFVTAVVIIAPFPLARLYPALPERIRRSRLGVKTSELLQLAGATVRSPRVLIAFTALVVIGFLTSAAGLVIAFRIVGEDVPLATTALMVAFVHVSNLVAITPGNLGIQELGLAALTGLTGYSLAAGVLASVVIRLSNLAALIIALVIGEIVATVTKRSPHAPEARGDAA